MAYSMLARMQSAAGAGRSGARRTATEAPADRVEQHGVAAQVAADDSVLAPAPPYCRCGNSRPRRRRQQGGDGDRLGVLVGAPRVRVAVRHDDDVAVGSARAGRRRRPSRSSSVRTRRCGTSPGCPRRGARDPHLRGRRGRVRPRASGRSERKKIAPFRRTRSSTCGTSSKGSGPPSARGRSGVAVMCGGVSLIAVARSHRLIVERPPTVAGARRQPAVGEVKECHVPTFMDVHDGFVGVSREQLAGGAPAGPGHPGPRGRQL